MGYWHGDEWRWTLTAGGSPTISVVEPADKRDDPENAHRVPFGFSVRSPQPEAEPLLWEGSD
jgi:hypothetical protein